MNRYFEARRAEIRPNRAVAKARGLSANARSRRNWNRRARNRKAKRQNEPQSDGIALRIEPIVQRCGGKIGEACSRLDSRHAARQLGRQLKSRSLAADQIRRALGQCIQHRMLGIEALQELPLAQTAPLLPSDLRAKLLEWCLIRSSWCTSMIPCAGWREGNPIRSSSVAHGKQGLARLAGKAIMVRRAESHVGLRQPGKPQ
jgi:hypothetical protein